jgi:hypothetical protein
VVVHKGGKRCAGHGQAGECEDSGVLKAEIPRDEGKNSRSTTSFKTVLMEKTRMTEVPYAHREIHAKQGLSAEPPRVLHTLCRTFVEDSTQHTTL